MDNDTQITRLRRKFSFRRFSSESHVTQKRLLERPSKSNLVGFQITNEDINRTLRDTQRPGSHRSSWSLSDNSTRLSRDSFEVGLSQPRLVKTPWEINRSRRSGPGTFRLVSNLRTSGKVQDLPDELLHCIFNHLRGTHLSGYTLKARSYRNDLHALCLTSKRWYGIARQRLYRELLLPANVQLGKDKATSRGYTTRLQLLDRTLNESQEISDIVRQFWVTAALADQLHMEAVSGSQISRHSTATILRNAILKCRNLEHFCNYVPTEFQPALEIYDALSSCRSLRSCVVYKDDPRIPSLLSIDNNWKQLETLIVWYTGPSSALSPGIMSAALQRLPNLKHLFLRGILPADFHNGTLIMLPPLKSLRLEELHGVTDQGIQQLCYGRVALSLERLILSGLELTSLQSVQSLFSSFVRLKEFTLYQRTSPEMPQRFAVSSKNFSLASRSIQYLHWDVFAWRSTAVTVLANSIAAGKFPSLRKVKIPCDDDGLVQNLCRPIPLRPISAGDADFLGRWEQCESYERILRVSRIQAQLRAMKERKQPSLQVIIEDDESIQHTHTIGSFLGNMASNIEYSLEPAVEGTPFSIARFEDVFFPHKIVQKHNIFHGTEDLWDLDVLF